MLLLSFMKNLILLAGVFYFPLLAIASAQNSRLLSVLSYNIKGLPEIASAGFDQDRYADIGRILEERQKNGLAPDLVLLQESFVSRTKELRDISNYPFTAKGPDKANFLLGVDSGLYILSRYPIIFSQYRSFGNRCSGWDCFSNKGVQLARVMVPGSPRPIDVYNTHMQASRDQMEVRLKQIEILQTFIQETHDPANPIIFAGDFNFRPGSEVKSYEIFRNILGLTNAEESCVTKGCYDNTWKSSVDHHFFADAAQSFVRLKPLAIVRNFRDKIRGRALSDHLGLETNYELRWR